MRLPNFREYKTQIQDIASIAKYLSVDLAFTLRDLANVLRSLSFEDNFDAFVETVTILAGTELAIRNKLSVVPTKRIILRSKSELIVDGVTEWTASHVYLKNLDIADQTVTVAFIR